MYGRSLTVRHLLEQSGTQARLAFLSACETGLVGTILPDEVVSLASGFLQAGAAGVVSTLWAVNDKSTALLAERFYRHWKGDGMAPADALAAAQRWLRDEADGGQYAHSYYWAGFTLTGV
jgi:CHAT domain-containing protein